MTRDPKRRARLRAWIESIEPTHALTLVVNRPMSVRNLKAAFGRFCMDLDRLNLGCRTVDKRMSVDRFQALMFVEHPDTNVHLHGATPLVPWLKEDLRGDIQGALAPLWSNVVKGSGDLLVEPIHDRGWAYYITKAQGVNAASDEADGIWSADFHPRDSVVNSGEFLKTLDKLAKL